jgi:hypothetical protein
MAPCPSRTPANIDRRAIAARCIRAAIVFDERHRTRQERYLVFGPRWQSLKSILLGSEEGLAEIQLEERFSTDLPSFIMHPAMLDLATGASLYVAAELRRVDDLFLLPLVPPHSFLSPAAGQVFQPHSPPASERDAQRGGDPLT